ncbi:Ribose import binding protein RbsB [anaerobic digester metagenome]
MKRLVLIALVLLALLGTGCMTSPSSNATPVPNGSFALAVIPPAMTSPFYHALVNGTIEGARTKGWAVEVVAPETETDHAAQARLMNTRLTAGADAVAVSPINGSAIVASVRAANGAGVPVFMFNLITPVPSGEVVEYIGYDQFGGAAALGNYTCRLLASRQHTTLDRAGGEVFILRGVPGFHTNRRTDGYLAGLAGSPLVTVVGEETANCLRSQGEAVAARALADHPNLSVFYATADEMAIGAVAAIEKSGRVPNRDVLVLGIDGNPPTLELVRDGRVTATLGVYPGRMGEVLVEQIERYRAGERLPPVLHTPWTVVDATNLAEYVAGRTCTAPVGGPVEQDDGLPTVS